MRQGVVSIQATVQERLVRRVTTKIDEAFISGLGVPVGVNRTQPEGLLTWSDTQALPGVGTLSLDDLHDALALAMAADVDVARLRWIMRSDTFVALKKLKSTDGRYLITPDPTEAGVFRLLGLPVIIANRIPVETGTPDTTSVVLADMSTIAVARDTNPSIKVLTERYAEFDQIGIRVVCRYDIQPLLPSAVIVLRGVAA